jgi:spermidine synthase
MQSHQEFFFSAVNECVHHPITLLSYFAPSAEQVLGSGTSDVDLTARQRLSAYWNARNQFLRAGVGVEETEDAFGLFQTAGEGLLTAVQTSPDFSAAYDPLLALAQRLKNTNPVLAMSILNRLDAANSTRLDARLLRERLFPQSP